ncbi:hypothetical protein V8C35DRAFT_309345 [Trichoderma chlorosporum]
MTSMEQEKGSGSGPLLGAASTANRFVYLGSTSVRHVLVRAQYCAPYRSALRPVSYSTVRARPCPSMTSTTPFDFANGPSTATAASASAAPATASSQGRHRRPDREFTPAQAAMGLAEAGEGEKEAWPGLVCGRTTGGPKRIDGCPFARDATDLSISFRVWRHSSGAWPAQWNWG